MDRPDHPFVLFNIGMTHADMGNHVEAVAAFQRSIEVSAASESHLRKAYALLAASHLQLDQLREAEGVCQAGCVLYPNDVELLFREGFIAHQLGQHERAISGYRRALEATDDRHFSSIDRGLEGYKTRHNLALVYEEVGKWGLAEEQWRLVVADVPSYRIGWRGLMNNLIQQKKYDRLAKEIDRVSQNAGFDIDVCHVRAQLATTRGNPSDALRELEDALLKYSSESTLLEGICQLLFEFGSPHDAAARLKELIALHPDNAAAWHNLGTTYLRLNDHCAAEDAFRTALAVRPDSAASHLYRGFALEQLGNLPAARAAWQAAIQAAPNAVTALEAQKRLGGVA